jgi:hypothetical protein
MRRGLYGILAAETALYPWITSKSRSEAYARYLVSGFDLAFVASIGINVAFQDLPSALMDAGFATALNTITSVGFKDDRRGLSRALPPIPVHRSIQAGIYLATHGKNLVQPKA